jgi:Ni,Fe-hydrogenase III component G
MNEHGFVSDIPQDAGVVSVSAPSDNRCFLELRNLTGLPRLVAFLTKHHGARLITITCAETPAFFELLHHMDVGGTVVTLRSRLWKPAGSAPSVAAANPAAELIEHEISELYGITFEGNPRPGNMILTEDRAKLSPLRAAAGQLEARIDGNILTIAEHGSTTAPSRRVMSVRKQMGMAEGPPLCAIKCPAKDIIFTVAEETGTASRHPKLKRGDAK